MNDFKLARPFIDVKELFQKISPETIYKRYLPDFPKRTFSPFRIDNNPSFDFYQGRNDGQWLWIDSAYPSDNGNIIDFLKRIEKDLHSFRDVLEFINEKFALGLGTYKAPEARSAEYIRKQKHVTNRIDISVDVGQWHPYEIDFWNQWMISKELCEYYWTRPADRSYLDGGFYAASLISSPQFFTRFPSGHTKLYLPNESRGRKFRSNCSNEEDVIGLSQTTLKARPGYPLVITKALKECMFYRLFGINAIAFHTEGSIPDADFIRYLRKYTSVIVSVLDNDPAGVVGAIKMRQQFIPSMFTCKAKNVTDLWLKDRPGTLHFINQLINEFRRISQRGIYSEYTRELCILPETRAY